jgi:hypothetical protein
MKSKRPAILWLAGILLLATIPTRAWWEKTHQRICRQAIILLPAPLQEFYKHYEDVIVAHAGDSDKWKRVKRHTYDWLDLELISTYPFTDIPADRAAADKKYGRENLEKKVGVLPWYAVEEYRKMVAALKGNDQAALIRNATHLSHHIADAHMPFHASVNFDGAPVGVKRNHGRIEGTLENNLARVRRADTAVLEPVKDPFAELMQVLRMSNQRVFQLLYWDAVACHKFFKGKRPEEGHPGYERLIMGKLGGMFTICLDEAARLTARFWYTAWQEAGKPRLQQQKVKIEWRVDALPEKPEK